MTEEKEQTFYQLSKKDILQHFNSREQGLSEEETKNRLEKYGPNQLTVKKKISALSLYIGQFKNILTLILVTAAILILFIYLFGKKEQSDLIEAGLILAIVFAITLLGFIQEFKAERAIESLKKLLAFKAKVRRDGVEKEIDIKNLVPGDIVVLEEGAKIPADIRLLSVASLSANEASLTGESSTVGKTDKQLEDAMQIADQKNMVFSGTSVTSGRGVGIVIGTGDQTEIGKIAEGVAEAPDDETPIQKKLNRIGKIIGFAILAICAVVFVFIVFFAQEFTSQPLLERVILSFIAAVALAVAAIPEGLPAVVTISLALGTQRMLKKNALVRKLNSVETLGSTDIVCADKTGTLTRGEMTVRKLFFDNKTYEVSGVGYKIEGNFSINNKTIDPASANLLLKTGAYCNNASISNETILGDPTEAALLVSAKKAKINTGGRRVFEIPFSSERKMMSVVVNEGNDYYVYTKGAPETLISYCSSIIKDGKLQSLSKEDEKVILDTNGSFSSSALRNLGFAYKKLSPQEYSKQAGNGELLEKDMVFVGIQGMIDPPRKDVKPLIESLKESGIRVLMITGDHAKTAEAVAKEIGITGEVLTGNELDGMSDEKFTEKVETVGIYARVNPSVKLRIVEALKKKNHIVAMTGDGVNDAPALKRADIGIAMGITGTDVAKEASDMVLLDDNFKTIVSAIEEGRGIFHNIRKFVAYLLSGNIAEVLVVFFALMLFQKLPLTAVMLLWINIITDGLPALALGIDPPEKGILKYKPSIFQANIINKSLWISMSAFGIIVSILALSVFYFNLDQNLEFAQTATFVSLVFFELSRLFIIRSGYKISFFSNPWLLLAVISAIILQIAIVSIPFFSNLFGLTSLGFFEWTYIGAISIFLWLFIQIGQKIFNRLS